MTNQRVLLGHYGTATNLVHSKCVNQETDLDSPTHQPDEDNDNRAAARQLTRAQEKWYRVVRVLTAEETSAPTQGYFYKAIIQAVILYRSERRCIMSASPHFTSMTYAAH